LIASDLRALAKYGSLPGRSLVARVAWSLGDTVDAVRLLRQAAADFEELRFEHYSALDRFALGLAIGGSEGSELRAQAEQRLRALGVADVTKDIRAYYPEFMERF
jgi:hypothetical protein